MLNPATEEIFDRVPVATGDEVDRALEAASSLDKDVMNLTVKEAEAKASLLELEQKMRLAKEELKAARGRIEQLKNDDLIGQRDATIRKLQNRVKSLESKLSSQRSERRFMPRCR